MHKDPSAEKKCISFYFEFIHGFCLLGLQLKGSDLELTIVKGSSAHAPLNGPACTYVNIRVKANNKEQGQEHRESLFFFFVFFLQRLSVS